MKSFYKPLIIISILADAVAANAGWNSNLSQNLPVSKEGDPNQTYVQCTATTQGEVWVSWLSWEGQNAYLKLQLLDRDGNYKFEEGGIYVSRQPTPTWSSGYDIASTPDGDAVIVYCDKRDGNWHAYLYSVGQDGAMNWGQEGLPLVPETSGEACLDPKLCITNAGNILIGFNSMLKSANGAKIYKFNTSGEPMWGGYISIPQTNGAYCFNFVATGDDASFVTYYTAGGDYEVMKFTANGEPAWEDAVKIDDTGVVSITTEPSVTSDGNGGFLTGWRNKNAQFSSIGIAQHIDSDGKKLWGAGVETSDLPQVAVTASGDCYLAYRYGEEYSQNLTISRIDDNGKELWQTDMLGEDSYLASIYGMAPTGDGMTVIYRDATAYNQATIRYGTAGGDGTLYKRDATVSDAPGDKGRGEIAVGDGQIVVTWEDNGTSKGEGMIFAQNIILAASALESILPDGEISVAHDGQSVTCIAATTFDEGEIRIIALDGKTAAKQNIPEGATSFSMSAEGLVPGLYIVEVVSGGSVTTEKIIVR